MDVPQDYNIAAADLGGAWGARTPPPPRAPIFFDFMQFSGNFGKIVCLCPPPLGLGVPPWEILDLPLHRERVNPEIL